MIKKENSRTTIKISKDVLQKMRLISATDGKTTGEWLEWVVNVFHKYMRKPKSNPFKEWEEEAKKGVIAQRDNFPPNQKEE